VLDNAIKNLAENFCGGSFSFKDLVGCWQKVFTIATPAVKNVKFFLHEIFPIYGS